MTSEIKKKRNYILLSDSSDSECSISVYQRKKVKGITLGQSSLKKFSDHSSPKFIKKENSVVRTAIKDKNTKFKCRKKENTCYSNVKPVIENKGKYNERVINLSRMYNVDEDPWDSSVSSDDDSSGSKRDVKIIGSNRKIYNGTRANKHKALNSVRTCIPLPQNKQGNKKKQEAFTNIRRRLMEMAEELKYLVSKFNLKIDYFQRRYLQDEIVTEQDGEDIICTYNNIINNLITKLTVQQQISKGLYHRSGMNYNSAHCVSGETNTDAQSSSKIFSANYKRPESTKISKPDIKNNVNKQPPEANCTSAVTVEKNNNTTSKSSESLTSILHRLTEINVVKTPSAPSVAGSISTVRTVPNLEVLNRAYKESIKCQSPPKPDSLRNRGVKENGRRASYGSDVNSTCSTVALYPRRNSTVEINNDRWGLIHAGVNKDVSSQDVSNRDVLNKDIFNRDVLYRDVLNRDVSKSPISDVSSVDGEMSDEIPLTNLYSSDSDDTIIIPNNNISAKGEIVLTSSNSENIRPKEQSEFVVPNINNLSANYQLHRAAVSNRADSVSGSKPTEQNQYNIRADKKLSMNCQVTIEMLRR